MGIPNIISSLLSSAIKLRIPYGFAEVAEVLNNGWYSLVFKPRTSGATSNGLTLHHNCHLFWLFV